MKLLACLLFPIICSAQKHDYIWVTGDSNSPTDSTRGGTIINFHQSPPNVSYNYRELNFRTCNASICDTAGNLLFYYNGCAIGRSDDTILENSEGLNLGNVYQQQCSQYNWYNSGYQSALILPNPDLINIFYLFHKRIIQTNNPFDVKSDRLFYSRIDMSQNFGRGKVMEKNIIIVDGSLSIGELTAVKHANGKDWWLVTPKRNSNEFYIFRFTKEGIVDTVVQSIGDAPGAQAEGGIQVCFSPDGSKYFRSIPSGPVMMYDFDRAVGAFTAYDTIHVDYDNWSSIANGFAVSPNSRYIYVCAELNIFQFDLWASDISASQVKVAAWDGFQDPVGTIFGQAQLGPDCKIYVSTIDARYYHVINNPDEAGTACNVTQHSFIFPTPTGASIPSFPNYRLGPLDNPGAPCTPTVGVSGIPLTSQSVLVWPNPAHTQLNFEWRGAPAGRKRLALYNVMGQPKHDLWLTGEGMSFVLTVQDLPVGVYYWNLHAVDGRLLGSGKIMKE